MILTFASFNTHFHFRMQYSSGDLCYGLSLLILPSNRISPNEELKRETTLLNPRVANKVDDPVATVVPFPLIRSGSVHLPDDIPAWVRLRVPTVLYRNFLQWWFTTATTMRLRLHIMYFFLQLDAAANHLHQ